MASSEGLQQLPQKGTLNGRASWITRLRDLSALLGLAGLLAYGIVDAAYRRFYEMLGVSPEDVGLGYGNVLVRSWGFIVFTVALIGPLAAIYIRGLWGGFLLLRDILAKSPSQATLPPNLEEMSDAELEDVANGLQSYLDNVNRQLKSENIKDRIRSAVLAVLILPAALGMWLLAPALSTLADRTFFFFAEGEALNVRKGEAVTPVELGPIRIFDARAYPATLDESGPAQPQDRKGGAAIKSVEEDSLLYLGQAEGILVLYDYKNQHALYIPASSVNLTVANCTLYSNDADCHL